MLSVYNENCITGLQTHVPDGCVDLVFTDPPYGIEGHEMHKHYARKESNVVDGYIDVPKAQYQQFSLDWIKQCERVLRPGGSMYIVSGYTCLYEILHALRSTSLIEINHIIWKFNFSVYTEKKWTSAHYHILYWVKPPEAKKTFNTYCRFEEKTDSYHDREDVILMNREYKPEVIKNKNQLPEDLIERFLLYSSNVNDVVLDPFLGGFTTATTALAYGRQIIGFEANPLAFEQFLPTLDQITPKSYKSSSPEQAEFHRRLKMRKDRNAKRNPPGMTDPTIILGSVSD